MTEDKGCIDDKQAEEVREEGEKEGITEERRIGERKGRMITEGGEKDE